MSEEELFKCYGPCGRDLPRESFKAVKNKRGVSLTCNECKQQKSREWLNNNHHRKRIRELAESLLTEKLVAESARGLNTLFKMAIEQQLKLYAYAKIPSGFGRGKARSIINDAVTEVSFALSRFASRIRGLELSETKPSVLVDTDRIAAFTVLEIPYGASMSDIKKAYKRLAKQHHPDLSGSEEKMCEINKAFELLVKGSSNGVKAQKPDRYQENEDPAAAEEETPN